METNAEVLFRKMELLYENIYNLLNGFQQASTTTNSDIIVPLKKTDGTIDNVTINSFQKLQQELIRIDNNYKSLINADNLSYTLEADGSISQQTKTSFVNAEYLSNFKFDGSQCVVDKKSLIDDLIFPSVKIPITIDSKLISDVYCRSFEITNGWENIPDNPTILDLTYLSNNGKIGFKEIDRTLTLEKQQIEYFGKFTIESIELLNSNSFNVILNDIKYTGINTIGNSIELRTNDILVSKSGSAKYIINSIDRFSKQLKITRIAGSESLSVGIDALYFNEKISSNENIVGIPIKPTQKLIVFLSTENFKNISFPSKGLKLDTTNYKVVYQNQTHTLDEFFSKFVTNFSEYLLSFVNETTIPINMGVKPAKPELINSNFKIVQINKHLTDTKTVNEINELNKRKQSINNEITFKQDQIDQLQQEVDTLKFKSADEKTQKLNKIIAYRQQINTLKQNLLVVTKDIDNNAIQNGLKTSKPKYRTIGFWPIQEAIYSPLTKPQNIIKYDVQYRYLSKDVDTVESTSYTMVANGKEVSVVFSPWNDLQTKTLNKVENINGQLEWETPVMDSIEDININQLSISINEGESIEIRIRAVSEAGYPIAPLKSEWSDIIRLDFPTELKQNTISSTISQNNTDLNKAEFENILQSSGLLSHIAGTIKEGDKTFLHSAKDIASGQYTEEQKNIPLDVAISNLFKEIQLLKNSDITNNVSIQLIDFNNEAFSIKNNTTMELFAGNYSDTVNLLDSTKWGSIIRKKGYIKIRNNNSIPIEIKSLIPTKFDQTVAPKYYNVPVKNVDKLIQDTRQIIYFRNVDLTNQTEDIFSLVKPRDQFTNTWPRNIDIENNALESERNIVYLEEDVLKTGKLTNAYLTSFISFTKEHPLFNLENLETLRPEFNRIKTYGETLKSQQYQSERDINDTIGVGFSDYDFYSIGANSCGAFLYPIFVNPETIKVVGNTVTSTLVLSQNSEILIPFMFEYRMIDRLGNVNGSREFDSNTPLIYSKKIGIDMFLNNELFKFDINVTGKLRSKITTIDALNISSITGAFNNEDKSELN